MKKSLIIIGAIFLMFAYSNQSKAQSTVTATTAGAVIITPIVLSEVTPLHFGVMAVLSGTPGTCVLSSTGVRTATGGVNLSAQTPAATNAAYSVTGQASTTYALTLPGSITVSDGGGSTMTISNLLARFNGVGADAVTSTLSAGGTDSFTVGGTLTVAAGQAAAAYAGTFDVTVAYN